MDDLIERLRAEAELERGAGVMQDYFHDGLLDEAADRITSLQQALEKVDAFFADFPTADLAELAADGGVTVGMVWQQLYEQQVAPVVRAALRGEG